MTTPGPCSTKRATSNVFGWRHAVSLAAVLLTLALGGGCDPEPSTAGRSLFAGGNTGGQILPAGAQAPAGAGVIPGASLGGSPGNGASKVGGTVVSSESLAQLSPLGAALVPTVTSSSSGGPTPTSLATAGPTKPPTLTPTGTPNPQFAGAIAGSLPPFSLPTNPPIAPPVVGPTPLGALGQQTAVPGGIKDLAIPPNYANPWVLQSSRSVAMTSGGQLGRSIAVGVSQPLRLAADGNDVLWVAGEDHAQRISLTQQIQHVGPHAAGTFGIAGAAVGLAVDGEEVWIGHTGGSLTRITKSTGATASFPVNDPTALALDGPQIWVTGKPDKLYQMRRGDGFLVKTYNVGSGPVGVVVDRFGSVWSANQGADTVSRLAAGAAAPTSISLGGAPAALAADPDRLWVALKTRSEAVYLGLDGSVRGRVGLNLNPAMVAVDALGRAWFADPSAQALIFVWGGK